MKSFLHLYENGQLRRRSALLWLLTRRRAYTGIHHFLYHVNNENSTGELFPPIPMFRLTIEFQSERKLYCLPPQGQVVELGTGLFKFTVEANLKKKWKRNSQILFSLPLASWHSTQQEKTIKQSQNMSMVDIFFIFHLDKNLSSDSSLVFLCGLRPFFQSSSLHQWKSNKQSPAAEPIHFESLSRCWYWFFKFIDGER